MIINFIQVNLILHHGILQVIKLAAGVLMEEAGMTSGKTQNQISASLRIIALAKCGMVMVMGKEIKTYTIEFNLTKTLGN